MDLNQTWNGKAVKDASAHYWSIQENIRQCLIILDNFWIFLKLLQHRQEWIEIVRWTILSNIWQYSAILDNFRQYWTILISIVQYLIVPNNITSILGNLASDFHFESSLVKEISNNFNQYLPIFIVLDGTGQYLTIFSNMG